MELYTGHQYAAVKMPEDKVAVFGNEFMLETIDADSEDVICSEGLFTLPEDKGFAIYDNDGNLDLYRTYSGDETVNDNNINEFALVNTHENEKTEKYNKIQFKTIPIRMIYTGFRRDYPKVNLRRFYLFYNIYFLTYS